MERDEVKKVAEFHGVRPATVREFLQLGIPEQDIDLAIETRAALCIYGLNGKILDEPTVAAMAKAYHRCEGDEDALDALVEEANTIRNEWKAHAGNREAPRVTIALLRAIAQYYGQDDK